jgi:uncharacterized protein YceH (UPF0502 family)
MSMPNDSSKPQSRWQPLSAIDRRVLGVLAEKAKTTPDAYPMSINGICTGANQKNNRFPLMQLEPDDVEESLERLRGLGAVAVIQGSGRVSKYRHFLYDWLGVDKVELAVMAELLLRGTQTEGELRGRAARMEPIADLAALRPVLESLKTKGLVIPLTPENSRNSRRSIRAALRRSRPQISTRPTNSQSPSAVFLHPQAPLRRRQSPRPLQIRPPAVRRRSTICGDKRSNSARNWRSCAKWWKNCEASSPRDPATSSA